MFFTGFEKLGFKTVNGRILYYPHGIFGSGYFVDEAARVRIESFLRKFYAWARWICTGFLLLGPLAVILNWKAAGTPIDFIPEVLYDYLWAMLLYSPVLIALLAMYEVWAWRLTSGLERSTIRITASEMRGGLSPTMAIQQMAFPLRMPRWLFGIFYWTWFVIVFVGGVATLIHLRFPSWEGLGGILSFFYCLWLLGGLHRERQRQRISKTAKT
jgi:hypothetical protein